MILKTEKLLKHFGGIQAVQDGTLSIEENRITAIIGPNGSGKSTLFNLISQLIPPNSGQIIFKGQDISKKRDYQVSRMGLNRSFQELRTFPFLTIKQHIEIALSKKDESLISAFFNKEKLEDETILKPLRLVGLDKNWDALGGDLSYGQCKLLNLAMCIAKKHDILLLDEPVAGVNPALREKIKQVLLTLQHEGDTLVLIEHDMNFVMDLAQHVIVMDAGKVIVEGKPEEVRENPLVLEAYLGESVNA